MNGVHTPVEGVECELNGLRDAIKNLLQNYQELKAEGSEEAKLRLSDIQASMAKFRAWIRDMELAVEEQEEPADAERWAVSVNRHKLAYAELQQVLRTASAQARRNIEQAALQKRRALLGTADPAKRALQLETQADLASAAADITASLQRTRQVMVEELDHTSATLAAMDVTTGTLRAARDEYGEQRGRLRSSRTLLRTMQRHSVLDRIYLWGGTAFFALVVLYLLQKRVAYFVPAGLVPALRWSPAPTPASPAAALTGQKSPPPVPPAPGEAAFRAGASAGASAPGEAKFRAGAFGGKLHPGGPALDAAGYTTKEAAAGEQHAEESPASAPQPAPTPLNASGGGPVANVPLREDAGFAEGAGVGPGATLLRVLGGLADASAGNATVFVEAVRANASATEADRTGAADARADAAAERMLREAAEGRDGAGSPVHPQQQLDAAGAAFGALDARAMIASYGPAAIPGSHNLRAAEEAEPNSGEVGEDGWVAASREANVTGHSSRAAPQVEETSLDEPGGPAEEAVGNEASADSPSSDSDAALLVPADGDSPGNWSMAGSEVMSQGPAASHAAEQEEEDNLGKAEPAAESLREAVPPAPSESASSPSGPTVSASMTNVPPLSQDIGPGGREPLKDVGDRAVPRSQQPQPDSARADGAPAPSQHAATHESSSRASPSPRLRPAEGTVDVPSTPIKAGQRLQEPAAGTEEGAVGAAGSTSKEGGDERAGKSALPSGAASTKPHVSGTADTDDNPPEAELDPHEGSWEGEPLEEEPLTAVDIEEEASDAADRGPVIDAEAEDAREALEDALPLERLPPAGGTGAGPFLGIGLEEADEGEELLGGSPPTPGTADLGVVQEVQDADAIGNALHTSRRTEGVAHDDAQNEEGARVNLAGEAEDAAVHLAGTAEASASLLGTSVLHGEGVHANASRQKDRPTSSAKDEL